MASSAFLLQIKSSRSEIMAKLLIANISATGEAVVKNNIKNLNEAAAILAIIAKQTFYAVFAEDTSKGLAD